MAEAKKDDDRERRRERNAALKASFAATVPQAAGGGAQLDSEVASLNTRLNSTQTDLTALTARVTALESGTEPEPPDPPDPEPGDKRFPDKGDPMCGVPAGTSLTTTGTTTISQNGAKVSGKKFTGRVTITGSDVEFFNNEVNTGDWWGIDVKGANCKIHHCTIVSSATIGNSGINTSSGTKVSYCRFRGWENAFNIAGSGNLIEWNDADDLKGNDASHYDTLQADGGFSNLEIAHNRFNCPYGHTSATMIDNYFGKISDVNIHDNWLGGGGMPCYLDGSFKGAANAVNVKYTNNVLKRGQWDYFYWKDAGSGCSHTGNVDATTGAKVD